LTKYYLNSTLYPALIAIVLTGGYSIADSRDYKSEWLTADSVVVMMFLFCLGYSIVLSLACLPIFLVWKKVIRSNPYYTALCWFLAPLSIITFFIAKKPGDVYFKLMSAPFLVGLCWTYVRYRRNIYVHDLKSIVKDEGA
jgi:hypothetical protein